MVKMLISLGLGERYKIIGTINQMHDSELVHRNFSQRRVSDGTFTYF